MHSCYSNQWAAATRLLNEMMSREIYCNTVASYANNFLVINDFCVIKLAVLSLSTLCSFKKISSVSVNILFLNPHFICFSATETLGEQ